MVLDAKQKTVVHYIADGEVKEFNFHFQIFEAGDIDVYLDETLTDSGYNVSVDDNIGGKVIFNQPPITGTRITIIRNLEIKRTSDFQEGGAFRAKVINHELDYQVATLEQLDEKINRSMICPPYIKDGMNMTLPLPSTGKALVWNEQESALQNSLVAVDELENITRQYREGALQSQNLAAESEKNAAESAHQAANSLSQTHEYEVLAKDWANKTTGLVDGKEYSAKKYAQDAEHFANQANITSIQTNCITKIPQDIKLELSNGTLTLKAGSKIYKGDGTYYTVQSDVTYTAPWANGKLMLLYEGIGLGNTAYVAKCYSGDSEPQSVNNGSWWFDTQNKIMKTYNNGWESRSNVTLPLGIISATSSGISSIDQVFNGFGYIGNTVFALPGVEGLIPNGRNADGSLNNTKFITTNVLTNTRSIRGTYAPLVLGGTTFSNYGVADYDENTNYVYANDGTILNYAVVGTWSADSTGRITSFNPKYSFQAIDRSELSYLSADVDLTNVSANGKNTAIGWGIPDYKAGISMTLPYTAPKNGVATFCIASNCTVTVNGVSTGLKLVDSISGDPYAPASIALNKNDVLNISGGWFDSGIFFPYKGV